MVLTELSAGQQGTHRRVQGVVVALGGLRVSAWVASCDGVPSRQGVGPRGCTCRVRRVWRDRVEVARARG